LKEVQLPYKVDSIVFDPDLWIVAPHENVVHPMYSLNNKVEDFKVYPNPANNMLYIEVSGKIFSLNLFDSTGRLKISKKDLQDSFSLSLGGLPVGDYLLIISTKDGKNLYKKIVKK
jgi:hypothetical protein